VIVSAFFEDIDGESEVRLRAVAVDIGHGRARSIYDLVLGWANHVGRLKAEQGESLSKNPDLWNEHDYVAALGIRDFLERGLAIAGSDIREITREVVSRADAEYVSFTQEKEGGCELLSRVANVESVGREWWWNRIPKSGFILDNLNMNYR
jgi:hypothetical protein